jgi:hypothetical protein
LGLLTQGLFNPLPSLTLESALDLNVPCQPKHSKAPLLSYTFKWPLKKTQSFCPCSRALNRRGKGLRHFWTPCKNKSGALLMHSLQMTLQIEQCMKLCKNISNTKYEIKPGFWGSSSVGAPFSQTNCNNLKHTLSLPFRFWSFMTTHPSTVVLNLLKSLLSFGLQVRICLHIFVFHSLNVVHPVTSVHLPPFYSIQNYFTFYILVVVICRVNILNQPTKRI